MNADMVVYPSLYPLTLVFVCDLCGKREGKGTYMDFRSQKHWFEFYEEKHYDECDGKLQVLVP